MSKKMTFIILICALVLIPMGAEGTVASSSSSYQPCGGQYKELLAAEFALSAAIIAYASNPYNFVFFMAMLSAEAVVWYKSEAYQACMNFYSGGGSYSPPATPEEFRDCKEWSVMNQTKTCISR